MQEEPTRPNIETTAPACPPVLTPGGPLPPGYALMPAEEDEINLLDLFIVLLKHKVMIFLVVLLAGIGAVFYSKTLPNVYRSEITIDPIQVQVICRNAARGTVHATVVERMCGPTVYGHIHDPMRCCPENSVLSYGQVLVGRVDSVRDGKRLTDSGEACPILAGVPACPAVEGIGLFVHACPGAICGGCTRTDRGAGVMRT